MEIDILGYVVEKALILIPVLYILGIFLKNTPFVNNWVIPWILLIAGIVGSIAIIGFNVDGFVQGVLCTGVTVLGNQLVKQTINKN